MKLSMKTQDIVTTKHCNIMCLVFVWSLKIETWFLNLWRPFLILENGSHWELKCINNIWKIYVDGHLFVSTHISSIFSSNSEDFASELLKYIKEKFANYYIHGNIFNSLTSSTTHWCLIRRERVNVLQCPKILDTER